MKKLALGVFISLIAACGSKSGNTTIVVQDGNTIDTPVITQCNLLTQTGCNTGEKCTWIHDDDGSTGTAALGHIGCTAAGTVADQGACQFAMAAMGGADNCATGEICDSNSTTANSGQCQLICDNNTGGAPMCATGRACVTFDGIFAASGATMAPAGICQPACNPLDDNDFAGSNVGTKTGSACGSDTSIGCYGFPASGGSGGTPPTHFICATPAFGYGPNPKETGTLIHRSPVPTGEQFLNSCAPGYNLSIFFDAQGSMQLDCFAFCAPANSFVGSVGTTTAGPNGASPHRCNNTDARGSFLNVATPTGTPPTNGEHCVYTWIFEVDSTTQMVHLSATSDTLGICIDHTKYQYDSNGDGTITAADAKWPNCATIPLAQAGGSQDPLWAGDFGCVDHTKGAPDGTVAPVHNANTPEAVGNFPRILMERPTFVNLPRSAN